MPTDEKIMDNSTNFGPEQNFNEYDDSMGTYQSDEPEVTPFVEPAESEFQGKKIKSVPKPSQKLDIDTDDTIISEIITAGQKGELDITQLEAFTNLTQNRNQMYDLIDGMASDPIIAAALETYAEDATEPNSEGKIVWSESSDPAINKFVTFLLDAMNVDKNIYKWTYSLCKYGDCYLKLFRNSEIEDDLFDDIDEEELSQSKILTEGLEKINEDVIVKTYSKNDKLAHYLEMAQNPAELYELTKFGKTYAYIEAKVPISNNKQDDAFFNTTLRYNFKKKDVNLHVPTSYVHASLEDNIPRVPEQVNIFRNDKDYENNENALTYTVKRGQSLLYNTFKIWRELMLLENSLILNRLTKSSILRIINVEVGDMPKEQVQAHLAGIKSLIEQKSALNIGDSMTEYINPGPMENNVYIPQRNGQGALNMQSIGGDVDVKGLGDIDYFKNKLYGALRIPKQYLGDTEDSTGFNGGTSLSIISSRYAKAIKRIQNTMLQALTDAINLMLIDKGLSSYVNKFELHMTPPTTQEEVDRMSNMQNELSIYSDILNMLAEIEDPASRLKISKALLSNVVSEPEILEIIEEQIEKLEETGNLENELGETNDLMPGGTTGSFGNSFNGDFGSMDDLGELDTESSISPEAEENNDNLPSPADLGVDMTSM